MPPHLDEEAVARLLSPGDALSLVDEELRRDDPSPRGGAPAEAGLPGGRVTAAAAAVGELGIAGAVVELRLAGEGGAGAIVLLESPPAVVGVVEPVRLRALRAGATAAAAARALARPGASTLGVIGCGALGVAHVECLRLALPGLARVVAFCRTPARLRGFCERFGAEPAGYGRDAAEQDVVVTATDSRDPVLRGEWLRPGALVVAAGATTRAARELDNRVLERATFVCTDDTGLARTAAGDLAEPVEQGLLDWLEVHGLAEVVGGRLEGRAAAGDVVVVKTVGVAALDLALAAAALQRASGG